MRRFGDDWAPWSPSDIAPSSSSEEIPYYLRNDVPAQSDSWEFKPAWDTGYPDEDKLDPNIPYYLARDPDYSYESQPAPESSGGSNIGKDLLGLFSSLFAPRRPTQGAAPIPVASQGLPTWGWVAIGVGSIVAVGLTIQMLRSSPSVAGYRRRKARR